MKEKIKHYIKEIIIFILVMTIFSNIISLYRSSSLSNEQLDNINIELIDGSLYKQDISRPLLVHFWASWCPTCKLEASNIQTISENFQVLTIAVKSGSNNDIKKYLDKHNFNYNVYNDYNAILARKNNVSAYPTTFIYDKNKNLVFSEVGYTSTFGLWIRMLWAGY